MSRPPLCVNTELGLRSNAVYSVMGFREERHFQDSLAKSVKTLSTVFELAQDGR